MFQFQRKFEFLWKNHYRKSSHHWLGFLRWRTGNDFACFSRHKIAPEKKRFIFLVALALVWSFPNDAITPNNQLLHDKIFIHKLSLKLTESILFKTRCPEKRWSSIIISFTYMYVNTCNASKIPLIAYEF